MSDNLNTPGGNSGADDSGAARRLRLRGDELAAEGSFSEAALAYEESIRLDEFDRDTHIKLVRAYFSAYEPQEAEAALQRLADLMPDDTRTYRDAVRFCLALRQDFGALSRVVEMGLALETKDTNYYLAKSYSARLKYMRETGAGGQSHLEEMIEAAEKSIELDSTNADAYYLLAEGLNWKYFNRYDGADANPEHYAEVIRALEKSLEVNPGSAHAATLLRHVYFSAGRYEDAAAACERSLKLRPWDNDPWFLLAEAWAHLGRFSEAVAASRQALERQDGARMMLGHHQSSVETLNLVINSDTDESRLRSACLLLSYAHVLFSRTAYKWDSPGRGDEAVESWLSWYAKALTYPAGEPDPLEGRIHCRTGEEYLELQRYEEARDALLKSAALHSDTYADREVAFRQQLPAPLALLGVCYIRMGLPEPARDALQKHVEMLRRTAEAWREEARALEAQPPGSSPAWRLTTLSALIRSCEEYEAEAAQMLGG